MYMPVVARVVYEKASRSRDISEEEKERLVRRVSVVWRDGEPENGREAAQYGVKQIFCDENSTVEQTVDMVAEYFGLKKKRIVFPGKRRI
jgi:hypothetical protein